MCSPYSTSTAKSHGVSAPECHGPVLREDIHYTLPPAVKSIVPDTPALKSIVPQTPAIKSIVPETPALKSIVPQTPALKSIVPETTAL